MALIANGHRFGHMPHKWQGSLTTIYNGTGFRNIALTGRMRNITAGEGISSDKVGVPMGYLHNGAWILPQKPGNLSTHNNARGASTATLTMVKGMAIAGASAGTCTVTATAKLVVSASASSAGTCTVSGLLNAALWGSGLSEGTCTVTGQKNALAWCVGQADGSCTATLGSYATGTLSGHIYVNQSEATVTQIVDGVWDAETADHEAPGTMGLALKSAGSAGDPWGTVLPGTYTGNQAGNVIGKKLLKKNDFIGLK